MRQITIRRLMKLGRVAVKDPALAVDASKRFDWLESRPIKRFSYKANNCHEIVFPGGLFDGIWHSEKRSFPDSCDIDDLYKHIAAAILSANFSVEYLINFRKQHRIIVVVNDESCSIQEKLGNTVVKASGISHNRYLCLGALLCIGHIPAWLDIVNDKNR